MNNHRMESGWHERGPATTVAADQPDLSGDDANGRFNDMPGLPQRAP